MESWNLLIVDDEVLTRMALRKGICWEKLGIGTIFEAGSASTAKEVLLSSKVDLVLIDIDMPGENGISLLEWIREMIGEALPCAFLTCHADFSYAKQAIHFNSVDYLLKPADFQEVENLILRMINRTRKEEENREMSKYAHQWLQEREQEGKKHEKSTTSTNEIVDRMVVYIRSHLSEKLSLAEMAHTVGLNMNYLNKVFKERVGYTVNQFIIKEKMELAAWMLCNSKLRAYAIAESLGYDNYSNFVNIFKKTYGVSPNQYAEQNRKKAEKAQHENGET